LNESTEDSKGWKNKSESAIEPVPPKRRFSVDTTNDLLFWGAHLAIIAISLGIVWVKMDRTAEALQKLLKAQVEEVAIVKVQAAKAEEAYVTTRKAEDQRAVDLAQAQSVLMNLVSQVRDNQASIKTNQDSIKAILDTVNETNQLVLKASEQAKSAALGSEHAAAEAAGGALAAANAASVAAKRAGAAAATSGRTATVVASKVVTQSDKVKIKAQQQVLAQKQQQLSQTIRRVKKTGATFWDKLTH
jgi:hypothetical protein